MKKLVLLALGLFLSVLASFNTAQAQVFHLHRGVPVQLPINAGETITIIVDADITNFRMNHTGFIEGTDADHVRLEHCDLKTGRWSTVEEHVCTVNSAGVLNCPYDYPRGWVQEILPTGDRIFYYTLSNRCGQSGVRQIMLSAD